MFILDIYYLLDEFKTYVKETSELKHLSKNEQLDLFIHQLYKAKASKDVHNMKKTIKDYQKNHKYSYFERKRVEKRLMDLYFNPLEKLPKEILIKLCNQELNNEFENQLFLRIEINKFILKKKYNYKLIYSFKNVFIHISSQIIVMAGSLTTRH